MKWFIKCIKQYADFKGRARRKEYWMFTLFYLLFLLPLALLVGIEIGLEIEVPVFTILFVLFIFALIVPTYAVTARRLHDTGRSGWWILINFIPYIGGIWLLVLTCLDSEPGTNKWGDNPKEIND